MAASPSHVLGELIGNFFEDVMKSPIKKLCEKYNVYFDAIGTRKARSSKKITWTDINGSQHDLDYVIERNGSETKIGSPIAFIELAWRRYTKHSKNKAQEIAGAINPIAEKYKEFAPFKGVILSGVFTEASLTQLKSEGFNVLYIPFEKVVKSFKKYGLDIFFDESTPRSELAQIVKNWEACSNLEKIKKDFIKTNIKEIDEFLKALENSIRRQIEYVFVLPLHGKEMRFTDIKQAISYLTEYSAIPEDAIIDRYVVGLAFNDGSQINCIFRDKEMAIDFLHRNSIC